MNKWTLEEDNLLIANYQKTKKDILSLFPNRTSASINIRASKLGIKKKRNEYCESKCDVLLEESLDTYYWIGFILADGHISQNKRIRICLSDKDKTHIKKFAEYIQCSNINSYIKNNKQYYYISAQDSVIIPKICKKFDINANKTYNPPKKITNENNKLLSLFIGYIDGDGSINKQYKRQDCVIRIKVHKSWLNILNSFHLKIEKIYKVNISKPKINNQGYASWVIANQKVILSLKGFIINNNISFLSRKWDLIRNGGSNV